MKERVIIEGTVECECGKNYFKTHKTMIILFSFSGIYNLYNGSADAVTLCRAADENVTQLSTAEKTRRNSTKVKHDDKQAVPLKGLALKRRAIQCKCRQMQMNVKVAFRSILTHICVSNKTSRRFERHRRLFHWAELNILQ